MGVLGTVVASVVMFGFGCAVAWLVASRRMVQGQPSFMPRESADRLGGPTTVADRTGEVNQLKRQLVEMSDARDAALREHDELAAKWNRVHDWYFDEAVPEFDAMQLDRNAAAEKAAEIERMAQEMYDGHNADLENLRSTMQREFEADRDAAVQAQVATVQSDFETRERQIGAIEAELSGKLRENETLRENLAEATMRWHETSRALRQAETTVEEMRQRRR